MQIAKRIENMEPSATLEMAQKSRELKSQGKDIISLSLGEPDFDTPDFIKNAAIDAINKNFSKYPPVAGYNELREAIVNKFKRDNDLDFNPSQIVVSTGAKQSLANIFLSVLNEGDEVIIFAPYWVTYYEQVKLAQGVPVVVQSDISTDFKVNIDDLKNASELALFILEEAQVAIVTGQAFGSDSTIRISYAASKENLIEAIKRIKKALSLLN